MLWIDTSITLNIGAEGDHDHDLRIAGRYVPPMRGRRGEFGVPLEPDEPADFILTHVDIRIGDGWHPFPPLLLTDRLLADLRSIGLAANALPPPATVAAAWMAGRRVAA